MSKFEKLMEEFKEKTKNADDMKSVMIAMEYGKIIDEQFTENEKKHFQEELMSKVSIEDLEKIKKLISMLKK